MKVSKVLGLGVLSLGLLSVPTTQKTEVEAQSTPEDFINTPVELTHNIKLGDTLYSIGNHYSTSVDAIAQANGIKNTGVIYAGQTLTIVPGTPSNTTLPPEKQPVPTNPNQVYPNFNGFSYQSTGVLFTQTGEGFTVEGEMNVDGTTQYFVGQGQFINK